MRLTVAPGAFQAFAHLLAQPDPVDLPRRAHVYRCDGDPNRRATRLPGILMAWLQRRHLEVDSEELPGHAEPRVTGILRRVKTGLRVVRRPAVMCAASPASDRGDDLRPAASRPAAARSVRLVR